MLCGALGIVFVCRGNLTTAFWLMVVASVFDFLDGFAARMLKAYSPMGKELDSLSDVVSFGLLPSFMMYSVYRQAAPLEWMSFLPFILVLFSAIRLAKFNVDTRQTEHFLGLPTPTSALLVASMVLYTRHSSIWQSWFTSWWVIPTVTVLLSALLISNIPMFSLKFKNLSFKENAIPFSFLLLCAVSVLIIALTGKHPSLMIGSCCGLYIIMSGIFWISGHHRR